MTTSQNRQPKGIHAGGQFAPDAHAEATLLLEPANRAVALTPGDGDTFSELVDGEVIETLNVSRSDDGTGYWVSRSKTLNFKDLITDSDPRLHGEALDAWLERNSPVIEDFLAERYEAEVTTDEGWGEVGVECTARLPKDGSPKVRSLTQRRTAPRSLSSTTNPTMVPSGPRTWAGSSSNASKAPPSWRTRMQPAAAARGAGLHDRWYDRHDKRFLTDGATVAIAKELNGIRTRRVIAYTASGRLAKLRGDPSRGLRKVRDRWASSITCLSDMVALLP